MSMYSDFARKWCFFMIFRALHSQFLADIAFILLRATQYLIVLQIRYNGHVCYDQLNL